MKFKTASAVLVLLAAEITASPNLREGNGNQGVDRDDLPKGNGKGKGINNGKGAGNRDNDNMPNIVVIMIDDLGWNQVGYHANPVQNFEIYTPSIDKHADEGIKLDRGYATPWCGPSRAAFQTGTLAAYNEASTQGSWSYGPDTGFVGGLPPELTTLPKALKSYAQSIGKDYSTSYAGKWGLQGSTWKNTPMGAGYDEARAFPSHSLDGCDGMMTIGVRGPPRDGSGATGRSLPGYWDQSPKIESDLCKYFKGLDQLSDEEKDIACHSQPRELPKIVDEDILDYTKDRILTHDYNESPLFHMMSTQLMHSPHAYPSKYDVEHPHPDVDLPDYFQDGEVKPPAKNKDMRLSLANAMRFVDDIFDETMQAIKDAGQWDNTIVLLTADNGGAIFPLNANNNYPLRGGKRSIFEGGYRVIQFLSGGWINKSPLHQKQSQDLMLGRTSDTFVFIQDWAPTFLEMVGGTDAVDHLYKKIVYQEDGTPVDPMEGNPMWKYLQNSLDSSVPWVEKPKQLPRKVSYNSNLFYDVRPDVTYKLMYTPAALPNFYIRKWAPTWPIDDEVIPDFGYISIMPCRPEGGDKPQECCLFKVSDDSGEDNPMVVTAGECEDYASEASELYLGAGDPMTAVGKACSKYQTMGCGTNLKGEVRPLGQTLFSNKGADQAKYSLWTQYGSAGPWISYNTETKEAAPVEYPTTKCVCEIIDPDITPGDVDAFIPTYQSPSICISLTKSVISFDPEYAVPCKGFVRTPSQFGLKEYGAQGIDVDAMEKLSIAERNGEIGGVSEETSQFIYRVFYSYVHREGFTEWPALAKWPYVTAKTNTCQQKKITPVPISITDVAPWFLNAGDGGERFKNANMCQPWNVTHSWCPSVSNPLQEPILKFDPNGEWAEKEDGTRFTPILKTECDTLCAKNQFTTAYIGKDDSNWGMAFDTPIR